MVQNVWPGIVFILPPHPTLKSLWKGLHCAMQFFHKVSSFKCTKKKKKFNSLYKIKKQYSRPNLFFKNLPYSDYFLLEPCSSSTVFIVFFPSRLCVWFVFPIRQWSVQGNFWQSINGIHKLANFTHSFLFYGAAVSFCYALVITWFVLAWHLLSQWGLRLIWN